jgi:hypothetical protein
MVFQKIALHTIRTIKTKLQYKNNKTKQLKNLNKKKNKHKNKNKNKNKKTNGIQNKQNTI